jgi:hypothetical protein
VPIFGLGGVRTLYAMHMPIMFVVYVVMVMVIETMILLTEMVYEFLHQVLGLQHIIDGLAHGNMEKIILLTWMGKGKNFLNIYSLVYKSDRELCIKDATLIPVVNYQIRENVNKNLYLKDLLGVD